MHMRMRTRTHTVLQEMLSVGQITFMNPHLMLLLHIFGTLQRGIQLHKTRRVVNKNSERKSTRRREDGVHQIRVLWRLGEAQTPFRCKEACFEMGRGVPWNRLGTIELDFNLSSN